MNNANKIKFIQLSNVDEEQLLAVIVLGGKRDQEQDHYHG